MAYTTHTQTNGIILNSMIQENNVHLIVIDMYLCKRVVLQESFGKHICLYKTNAKSINLNY